MLVLSRKVGEEIVIANTVIVAVARVFRDRASLTIQAPAKVLVDRKEIRLAKNRDHRAATLDRAAERQAGSDEVRQS
jgi:carbon storage regulator CsrA